jgi:hypothetical protein
MHVSFFVVGFAVAGLCVGCSQSISPAAPTSVQSSTVPQIAAGENPRPVSAPAIAQQVSQNEVPFKGDYEGLVTIHVDSPNPYMWWTMSGSGNATKLGRFTVQVTSRLSLGPGLINAGYYTFTAANGDTLNAFFGQVGTDPPSTIESASILGGSGRFAGAAGTFTITRVYDPTTGTTAGSFEGTISRD